MAHSSSGDSCNSAPEIIDPFSSDEKNEEPQVFCPLCLRKRMYFYCERCIRNGSFTHSADMRFERFADKKLKIFKLIEKKERLLKRYQDMLSERIKTENMKLEVSSRLQTNEHLKAYIKQIKEKLKSTVRSVEKIRHQNEDYNSKKSKLEAKISHMENKVNCCRMKIKDDEQKLRNIEASVKHVRQESIQQLVIYIFPISKVKTPENYSTRDYSDPDDLFDAIYVTGQWELAGVPSCHDFQYKIIDSYIPANGNYNAYIDWTAKIKDEEISLTDEDCSLRDTANSILTALSFTAHLLTVLCFYLDAHMPKRLTPNEFNCKELSGQMFLHKVAKLNIDVIYLCLLQNVDPAHIRPHHTMKNLLLLLDPCVSNLGRSGPVEVTQRLPSKIENILASDLLIDDDSDDESSGNFDDLAADWVKIKASDSDSDHMVVCEFGSMTDQTQYVSQVSSITGELMSSMTYFWKAATWQK